MVYPVQPLPRGGGGGTTSYQPGVDYIHINHMEERERSIQTAHQDIAAKSLPPPVYCLAAASLIKASINIQLTHHRHQGYVIYIYTLLL